jgi:DNA-binding transcriptional LysR family regulator
LQKLEEKLGRCLINRKRHGFGLTTDGQIFLQHAKRISNELTLLNERFKKTYSSELLICCEPAFSTMPLRVIRQFNQMHLGVPLHFHAGDIDSCFSRLHHRRSDIIIVHEPRNLIHIEFDLLLQERLVVAFHSDSPLSKNTGPLFLSTLHDAYVKWSGAPQKMLKRLNNTFQHIPIAASSDDFNTAMELASLGLGWMIVTERLVRSHRGRPLGHRLIADRWAFLDVYVGWRSTDKRHDLHDFLDLIRDAYDGE